MFRDLLKSQVKLLKMGWNMGGGFQLEMKHVVLYVDVYLKRYPLHNFIGIPNVKILCIGTNVVVSRCSVIRH